MSSVIEAPPVPAKEEKTEAGNYFVSNYPPFSFWKPDQVGALEAVLDKPAPVGVPLGVYFHIPFCRKRCHFCYFKVYTDKNAREIRAYIDAGMKEMAALAARPYLKGRKAQFVYFGGGTPSYLSVPQLKKLTAEGFMEIAGPDWVKLTREGLLQSDRICYEFFLPQHTQYARYT